MALTKREYDERKISREEMPRYERAFNHLRPGSARIIQDQGESILLVQGWLGDRAAALVHLVRQGLEAREINEALLQATIDRGLAPAEAAGTERDLSLGTPIDPLAPPPPEPPLMDLSDLPPVTLSAPDQEAPPLHQTAIQPLSGGAGPPLSPERRKALCEALARLLQVPEEQALRWAIREAGHQV